MFAFLALYLKQANSMFNAPAGKTFYLELSNDTPYNLTVTINGKTDTLNEYDTYSFSKEERFMAFLNVPHCGGKQKIHSASPPQLTIITEKSIEKICEQVEMNEKWKYNMYVSTVCGLTFWSLATVAGICIF